MKLVTLDEAALLVSQWRTIGATIVLANGAFDLLHVGHVRYLVGAKALGTHLVVGVNSDSSVRASKGPSRPIISHDERAELISALACTDAVILFDGLDVRPLIRALKPDIHAKGTDYTADSVPERDEVMAYGGRVAITGDSKSHSTTAGLSKLNR